MKLRTLIPMSLLVLTQAANAASMTVPEIEFSFFSQDGIAVEGVSLTGMLRYDKLTMEDCTGPICIPSLPHYVTTAEAGKVIGETNENGQLTVASSKKTAPGLTAKNLRYVVFSSGLVLDVCKDQSKTSSDILQLLPQFMDGKPVQRNPECQTVEVAAGDQNRVQVTCYSPYSYAEIQKQKEAVASKCAQ